MTASVYAQKWSFPARLSIVMLLTVAADFLFYDHSAGISVFIFTALLAMAITVVHARTIAKRGLLIRCTFLFAGLLPLVEEVTELSLLIALFSLTAFALSMAKRLRSRLDVATKQIIRFISVIPARLIRDIFRWRKAVRRTGTGKIRFSGLAIWLMPVVLTVFFISMFGLANPVIEHWLSLIDVWAIFKHIEIIRIIFWAIIIVGCWAFIRPRVRQRAGRKISLPRYKTVTTIEDVVFGKAAILRALVMFNVLFVIQTVLDGAYLWGGIALPDGMSYARYAHSGAYPLIVTALLAALFVLIAMRPSSASAGDKYIRLLVYMWIAQNVVLVASSILRLELYVSIYSLTYWRVAALIWMVLVAIGLLLILARIALGKTNEWLCTANLLTLFATLYLCCFVNFAALIADYNIRHSRDLGGEGVALDTYYLKQLGPAAVPAIRKAMLSRKINLPMLSSELASIVYLYERYNGDWREWSFRGWRLSSYLQPVPFIVDFPHLERNAYE
ncbi:DUF4173 domain-containing protein [Phyllobacterium sp. YR531]|uniref:DUF4153 domain-containing protein n=1 Tax=Phyllobacterium sp. YR531 TaxID=1144343 RepID=UPI00026F63CC|nr:DUF4173 domain-containing protein [Phyllobacterium sp. YR531]EJN03864.1 hypothetical protein PMI41_01499 [Phyllobacterium sp. YR531]